ncbi:MAG: hypothetical protein EA376_13235 [Phycisphaeraceae bacterium]|nr:MAG: hypothetical protein EA376_13235 [Phycisphaeraceae bacterium]
MLKRMLLVCFLTHALAGVAAAFIGLLAPRWIVIDTTSTRVFIEYGTTLIFSLLFGALCPLGFAILLHRIVNTVKRAQLRHVLLIIAICLLFTASWMFQSYHFPPLSLHERRSSTDVVYWVLYPIYMGAAGGVAALVALAFRRNPD